MGSRRPPDLRTLASLSRVRLLYALLKRGSLPIDELADEAELHPNTTREHLHRLIDDGFVVSHTLASPFRGRPKVVYALAADRNDPIQAKKIRLAKQRIGQLNRFLPVTIEATRASAASAADDQADDQADMVEDHMDQCGFDSTVDREGLCLNIRTCPVETLAREHPEVCQVHFHLVDSALHRVDGPLETTRLNRLHPTNGCSVDLHRTDGDGALVQT
ncbi:MAG: ArsR family transcriptional regulator [Lacisediminihabitans sp.]